eukprot:CAMPEP_0119355114 /NCGR_PEP_ID=MMETSP1334-20130426/3995_1 /TAXON_ID=127549 /ORGANISM="Calcidiscus leptoporus, Strain RCC1130" /LENGTH=384 /DNA_ID=CAMNT_0007368839 /DNA_START=14 /DNA_END=1168 /DNA_ORIENTATION=-
MGAERSAEPACSSNARVGQPGSAVHKLLNAGCELECDELKTQLSEQTDFTVVGVLGMQGVGKSTIMSLLAGSSWQSEIAHGAPSTHQQHDGQRMRSGLLHEPTFAPQTTEVALRAAHQTEGIDVHVTAERLILLDTQPMLSASVLLESVRRESALPAEVQSHENLVALQSMRIAMLVLSVCHLVVLVQDSLVDVQWLRLLRTAETLRHRIPDISVLVTAPAAAGGAIASDANSAGSTPTASALAVGSEVASPLEYQPQAAFVLNRMASSAFVEAPRRSLRTLFSKTLAGEALGRPTASGLVADAPQVYLLPTRQASSATSVHRGYQREAERLRDELLALPRRHFAKPLSERDWLRGVVRMWELIRKSQNLSDFNRSNQKLHLYL